MTRVMVVEDNLTLLESISFELEMQDFDVISAEDGQKALDLLQGGDVLPDIIVSDIAMPDLDGYKLLELIRNNPTWSAIPLIFLTAFDSKNAMQIGKELGADDYLVKPFEPDELIVAIKNKIRRMRDITAQTTRQLSATHQELIHMLSHELRTPMTSIYGSTSVLEHKLADVPDEITSHMLSLLKSGTNRMNHLINRVLYMVDMKGKDAQSIETKCQPLDLHEMIQTAIKQHTMDTLEQRDFILNFADKPLTIFGVREHIKLALYELIDNEVRYASHDAPITITTQRQNDVVTIHIKDEGEGIAPELFDLIQHHLTDSDSTHYTLTGTNRLGMGLALVKQVLKTHQGSIKLDSTAGVGTQVSITLPAA